MIYKAILTCLILNIFVSSFESSGQPSLSPFNLYPPLSGELNLSGSFGEVRTNSFHAGIDFRTGGRTGLKVYSSDIGFVSRIKVSSVGFGKAIYIQHPNGLTTVYAHLDRFANHIEDFVKEHQYKQKSFEVDLSLNPNTIKVNRGENIGFSGNSGSSGGPHLHYEVRLTKNQIPLNPAFSNLKITDSINPVINSIWIYSLDSANNFNISNTKSVQNVQYIKGEYVVQDTIRIQSDTGLGIKTFDYINRNSLRCGVYEIKMFVNNSLQYHFSVDEFSFGEIRYANSHIDYAERQETGKRINKLFREPNNLFRGYKSLVNNGVINFQKDSTYNITVAVNDPYGNGAELKMVMLGEADQSAVNSPELGVEMDQELWLFYQENQFSNDYFSIVAPKNILYNNLLFTYGVSNPLPGSYSSIVHVHNKYTPVHRHYELSINADSVPTHLQNKALIATLSSKDEVEAVGGSFIDGKVVANVNFFGDFFISIDTIPPSIRSKNLKNGKFVNVDTRLLFEVNDDFSGVASIEGLIDDQWALFEHDPKNSLVFYKMDEKRISRGKNHSITLKVTDFKGNESVYNSTFFW